MTSRTTTSTGTGLPVTRCAGGSAAKWERTPLNALVQDLASLANPDTGGSLLVGLDDFDDAAVVQLAPDLALVSAVAIFPPVVEDPARAGAVAGAAACSNVLAMGASVTLALNIVACPEHLPAESLKAMLEGAAEVVAKAGGVIGGGHTICSEELLFGLAVQGLLRPTEVLRRSGARAGDVLVLSKPIGTGVVLAAGSDDEVARTMDGMVMPNRLASECLRDLGGAVHATSNVGGDGLVGHAHEIAEQSGCCLELDSGMLPCYRGAKQLAGDGVRARGEARNRSSFQDLVLIGDDVSVGMEALAFDPQTSGGLLSAVEPDAVPSLVDAGFKPIGTVREVDTDADGYATEPMVQLR